MRKAILIICIFLICLTAVRCVFGLRVAVNSSDLMAYVGSFTDNSLPLRDVLQGFSDIWEDFQIIINGDTSAIYPSAGGSEVDGTNGGGHRFGNDSYTWEDVLDALLLAWDAILLTFRFLWELLVMLVSDFALVLQILAYLLFGII